MLPYAGVDFDFSLEGKTAVITGGAAGIGYETAKFFHEKKVNVVLADLNPNLETIAGSIGDHTEYVIGNVCDHDYPKKVIEKACETVGRAEILVHCAGIVALDKAESLSETDWNRTMDINLSACFFMAQAIGKYWIENKIGGGCIVNMASQAGVIALDKHVAYCAAKGGIIAMTKVLAKEWGKYGIRVNAVSPTVVLTELGHKAWDGPVGEAFKKTIPGERFAEPDEIAAVIAFLCSKAAGMITGHNLLVDGGFTIQ